MFQINIIKKPGRSTVFKKRIQMLYDVLLEHFQNKLNVFGSYLVDLWNWLESKCVFLSAYKGFQKQRAVVKSLENKTKTIKRDELEKFEREIDPIERGIIDLSGQFSSLCIKFVDQLKTTVNDSKWKLINEDDEHKLMTAHGMSREMNSDWHKRVSTKGMVRRFMNYVTNILRWTWNTANWIAQPFRPVIDMFSADTVLRMISPLISLNMRTLVVGSFSFTVMIFKVPIRLTYAFTKFVTKYSAVLTFLCTLFGVMYFSHNIYILVNPFYDDFLASSRKTVGAYVVERAIDVVAENVHEGCQVVGEGVSNLTNFMGNTVYETVFPFAENIMNNTEAFGNIIKENVVPIVDEFPNITILKDTLKNVTNNFQCFTGNVEGVNVQWQSNFTGLFSETVKYITDTSGVLTNAVANSVTLINGFIMIGYSLQRLIDPTNNNLF